MNVAHLSLFVSILRTWWTLFNTLYLFWNLGLELGLDAQSWLTHTLQCAFMAHNDLCSIAPRYAKLSRVINNKSTLETWRQHLPCLISLFPWAYFLASTCLVLSKISPRCSELLGTVQAGPTWQSLNWACACTRATIWDNPDPVKTKFQSLIYERWKDDFKILNSESTQKKPVSKFALDSKSCMHQTWKGEWHCTAQVSTPWQDLN